MKFKIDKKVFDKFPTLVTAVVVIKGFNNKINESKALNLLRAQESDFKKNNINTDLMKHKNIVGFTQVFKETGIDPEKMAPAHLALCKRAIEGKEIPDINPIVNLINAMSLKFLTPLGAENLDQAYGDSVLRVAKGGEQWIPIGSSKSKPANRGELVWIDDYDVCTRSWNWRQCERTKITKDTKNGYFIMDGFSGENQENVEKAAKAFVFKAEDLFGGKGKIYWLNKDNPEVELFFKSKKKATKLPTPTRKASSQVEAKKMIGVAKKIYEAIRKATGANEVALEHPELDIHGDYSTNIALVDAKSKGVDPKKLAKDIVDKLIKDTNLARYVSKIETAGTGFINFWLKEDYLKATLETIISKNGNYGRSESLKGKRVMVEFAHPNTHKEMHIGHMRTLIVGESLARILEWAGAEVFRANYQGDIGPHVAKAIWGTTKILKESNSNWEKAEKLDSKQKAHLLGEGYVLGNNEYKENEKEIVELNKKLYNNADDTKGDYQRTRRWSLEYYDTFYRRFDTKFDKLFFESEVAAKGKELVEKNVGRVFEKSEGALIFDGEKYGLHKRVFVTKEGTPTYEGKEMALAPLQHKTFPFDLNIHVVANEQKGYFQVVIKALEELDPSFKGKEFHLSMGMVNLVGAKISSRKGVVITVDGLLDDVKKALAKFENNDIGNKDEILEHITIASVKCSVLKTSPVQNVAFDIEKSINIKGDSGPYLQYTYARAQSILRKATGNKEALLPKSKDIKMDKLNKEEKLVLRSLSRFPEVIDDAAKNYSPNVICTYLFDLAQKFNSFYNAHGILKSKIKKEGRETVEFRLVLTKAVGIVIKNGLHVLGIQAPDRM